METENEVKTEEKIPVKLLVLNFLLVVFIIWMIFVIQTKINNRNESEFANILSSEMANSKAFDNLELSAKSAYVYDVYNQKVLYKKNEFTQLPLASITKIMTAIVAVENSPLDRKIKIEKEYLEEVGDNGLLLDEVWNLQNLLDFSLVVSSNDGARAISSSIGSSILGVDSLTAGRREFIRQMNIKAEDLGMKQTYFVNESGLDQENISGGYGSAIDVATMFTYALQEHPSVLEVTKNPNLIISSFNKTHNVSNTNTDIGVIPGLIASKTGYTEIAGGNLAIAFDTSIGRPIIVVVLGSTREDRFSDVAKLVNASLAYITE